MPRCTVLARFGHRVFDFFIFRCLDALFGLYFSGRIGATGPAWEHLTDVLNELEAYGDAIPYKRRRHRPNNEFRTVRRVHRQAP